MLECRQWHRKAVDTVLHNQLNDTFKGSFDPFRTTWRVFVQVEYYCTPLVAFLDNVARCHWLLVNEAGHQSYGMFIQLSRGIIRSHQLPRILLDDFYIDRKWWYFQVISAGQYDRI